MDPMVGLILICSSKVPLGQCWPKQADAMFVATEDEIEQPEQAVKTHKIGMRDRYIVVRNISCGPEAAEVSHAGEKELPAGCRDLGTANGHCASPLYKGRCPD